MQSITVTKGSAARISITLYSPANLGIPVDPIELSAGPQLALGDAFGHPVTNYTNIPFSRRLAPGVYVWQLPITLDSGVLAAGTYTGTLIAATLDGSTPLVDATGHAPQVQLVITAASSYVDTSQPYATPDQLTDLLAALREDPASPADIRFAQGILDGWMHRSLWPTNYEGETHRFEPQRALFRLGHVPVLQLYSMEGRWGYGRRNQQQLPSSVYVLPAFLFNALGPQNWTAIDVGPRSLCRFDSASGEVWLPQNYILPYSQTRTSYQAGLTVIPHAVHEALAETIGYVRFKGYAPLTGYTAGKMSRQFKSEDFVTVNVQRKLEPWRTRSWAWA